MNCFNLLSCENTLMYFTYRKNLSNGFASTCLLHRGWEGTPRSTRPVARKGPGSSAAAEGWARANGSRAPVEAREGPGAPVKARRVGWSTPVTGGSS
jgi:hypothetical protein